MVGAARFWICTLTRRMRSSRESMSSGSAWRRGEGVQRGPGGGKLCKRYDKLRFIRPVFIGDTLYTVKTALDKQPKYKEIGLYHAGYEIFKNDGDLVLYCERLQTVKYRRPENFQVS